MFVVLILPVTKTLQTVAPLNEKPNSPLLLKYQYPKFASSSPDLKIRIISPLIDDGKNLILLTPTDFNQLKFEVVFIFIVVDGLIGDIVFVDNEVADNVAYVNVPIVLISPVTPSIDQTFAPVAVLKTPIILDVLKNKYLVPPITESIFNLLPLVVVGSNKIGIFAPFLKFQIEVEDIVVPE